jgi:hypothetical protein
MVVQLVNQHLQETVPDIPVTLISGQATMVKLSIPNASADATHWAAGIYSVSIAVTTAGTARSTNSLALPFAPQVTAIAAAARDGEGNVLVTVTAAPIVQAAQEAFLSLPDRDVAASLRTHDTDPLQFSLTAPAAGPVVVRLRVDGVDSMQFTGQGVPLRPVLALQTLQIPA